MKDASPSEIAQRRQLSRFLKSCRARRSPREAGLPETGDRRTPGLRREEVATLADVSVSWYTWLEQGRAIHVSTARLERVSEALALSRDEREYLFTVVQHQPAPRTREADHGTNPTLRRVLDTLGVPAHVMTARWDIVAWNPLTNIFHAYERMSPERRNLLRLLLVDEPVYRRDPIAYERMARRVLSKFRVDYSQAGPFFDFEQLISELEQSCPIFRKLWGSHDVLSTVQGVGTYPHLGGLQFEHSIYVPEGDPMLRLVTYIPFDEDTATKVAEFRSRATAELGAKETAAEHGSGRTPGD
jgi:transcriptional regulator with XRE-family HTH domain